MSDVDNLQHELMQWWGKGNSAFEFCEAGTLDGIWCWNLEVPQHKWFSDSFWRVLGHDPQEPSALPGWGEVVLAEDVPAIDAALARLKEGRGGKFDQLIRYQHADGGIIWKHSRGIVVPGADGQGARLVGADRDLTPLMRAREEYSDRMSALEADNRALEKRVERFHSLVESAPDAVVITDKRGQIVLVNAQTEKLFGYARAELNGLPVETLIPQRYRAHHPNFRDKYHNAPHARPMGSGMDLYGLKKNGEEFPVEISLNVMETEEGRLVSAAIRDVTAQKQAAEAIHNANARLMHQAEELEKSNLELQNFAYVVSHDLQTPLRSIAGFVQLLQAQYGDKLDEQANEWIGRTVLNTKRMQKLIQDILAYSRIESRVTPFTRHSLQDIYNEAVDVLRDSIQEAGATVTATDLPVILCDRPQMVQLMQNLIGNALKYRRETAPQISITGCDGGQEWIIAVRDNGIGIAPEHFQRIFDVFQRLHTQKSIPGTGIGLSICRRVIQRHGGKIWVESETGRGSCFSFSLPKPEESTV